MAKIKDVRFYDKEGNELTTIDEILNDKIKKDFTGVLNGGKVHGPMEWVNMTDQTISIGKMRYKFITKDLHLLAKKIESYKFGNIDSSILISPCLSWAQKEIRCGHSVALNAKTTDGYLVLDTIEEIHGDILIGKKSVYQAINE